MLLNAVSRQAAHTPFRVFPCTHPPAHTPPERHALLSRSLSILLLAFFRDYKGCSTQNDVSPVSLIPVALLLKKTKIV